MADETVKSERQRVLRVNQLDAAQLDEEIIRLLRSQLSKAFQYFEVGVLTKYEAELNGILRFLVWRFSVYSCDATVGQHMLNMKYASKGLALIERLKATRKWAILSSFTSMSGKFLEKSFEYIKIMESHRLQTFGGTSSLSLLHKLLIGFCVVGIPYLKERSSEIQRLTDKFLDFKFIWRCINIGEKLLQALSVLNFLVFLQKGKYPSVLERVLGIHPVFAQRQSIRQVSFEFMTRELLWHGFAEFVFFLLPLINIHKLKNLIVRRFSSPASLVKQPSIKVACHECGICNEPPTAPHQGQCGHVFCYYCIKANSLADPSFPCPLCGAAVGDEITPVECTVALEVS